MDNESGLADDHVVGGGRDDRDSRRLSDREALKRMQWRWGLLALTGVTIVSSYVGLHHANQKADCLADYNIAKADRDKIASQLGTEQNEAVNDLLNGAGRALSAKNTAAFPPLFATFKQRTDAIAAERAAHPVPTLDKDCR